jgi:signal transduction histidine kinase/CheY-like chemotaxis protein
VVPAVKKRRILIVHNPQITTPPVLQILRLERFESQTADSPGAALSLATSFQPDAIVCIHQPPDLDGTTLHTALRSAGSAIPMILLTEDDPAPTALPYDSDPTCLSARTTATDLFNTIEAVVINPPPIDLRASPPPSPTQPAEVQAIAPEIPSGAFDIPMSLLDENHNPILCIDPDGRLGYLNAAGRTAFGVAPETLAARPLLSDAIDNPELATLLTPRSVAHWHGELAQPDRQLTWQVEVTCQAGTGCMAVLHDISHLKELDRVKSEFIERVSRDIRSPLTTILGYVELLERMGNVNDTQHTFIERITFGVQSITALLSDLLDLSRVEADFEADREPVQFALIVRYAVEGNRQHFETCNQSLSSDIPERLPPVLGNPLRLRQMVDILLDNANKYTHAGGRVNVILSAQDNFLVLSIEDTGLGIPATDQPHVFERFYRGQNVQVEGYEGSGLGLTIVKTIVDKYNGRIWVESTEDEGATFTVMLPTYTPSEQASASPDQ